jgi:hypothetical protein
MNQILTPLEHMYYQYDFDVLDNISSMNNRLFCTFTTIEDIDSLVREISLKYEILYNKVFALKNLTTNEYVITYNIDQGNISSIPENTILVHRKKETNTLYTINALNTLIKSLNKGVVDIRFPVNWG